MADLDRRLTTLDSAFLYFEKSNEPMHIGACSVYDGDLTAETVAAVLEARMHHLVPDVWELSGYLQESYEELRKAAFGAAQPEKARPNARAKPKAKARQAKPKKPAKPKGKPAGRSTPVAKKPAPGTV